MLIEPTHAKAEDISTHMMSRIIKDATMNNGDGKTTDVQFTSHSTTDAVPSNQPPFLSNVRAATHQQKSVAHEGSEESPSALRSPLIREGGSLSGHCENIILPSVEDNR